MTENTKIPSFDLTRNYARVKEVNVAVLRVLDTQHFILGPEVEALEKEIAAYLEVKNAVGCASGTDALVLALMALDLKPGDEVITTPFTFFATVSCTLRATARRRYSPMSRPRYLQYKERRYSCKDHPADRAVLPVHLFGQMCL